MKTLDEIYAEVLSDAQLTATAKALHTAEEQVAFVKAQGGDATAEEIADFLVKKSNSEGELTDAELQQVAGGKSYVTHPYHTLCHSKVNNLVGVGFATIYYCKVCDKCVPSSEVYWE